MTPQLTDVSSDAEHRAIKALDFVEDYLCFEEIDSTNSFAKNLKNLSANGLTVVRALRQSCGRGSREKTFFSDHSGGLWVSIVTPVKSIEDHFIYNRAISLAICETLKSVVSSSSPALSHVNNKIAIKWPNDVYCSDRKIAGILLENVCDNPNVIIAGFGLNVNIALSDFPFELRRCATSVQIETGKCIKLEPLLERILTMYWQLSTKSEQQSVHRLYVENLYKKGCGAVIDSRSGTFETVEIDGQLRMRTDEGDFLCSCGSLRFL